MNAPTNCRLTPAEFTDLMNRQTEFLKLELESLPSSITPHLWLETVDMCGKRESQLCALLMPFNEDVEKRVALATVAKNLLDGGKVPIAAFLSSEAWQSNNEQGVEPRHAKSRSEVVVVFGLTLDQEQSAIGVIPIKRDAQNRMHVCSPPSTDSTGKSPLLAWFFGAFAMMAAQSG